MVCCTLAMAQSGEIVASDQGEVVVLEPDEQEMGEGRLSAMRRAAVSQREHATEDVPMP